MYTRGPPFHHVTPTPPQTFHKSTPQLSATRTSHINRQQQHPSASSINNTHQSSATTSSHTSNHHSAYRVTLRSSGSGTGWVGPSARFGCTDRSRGTEVLIITSSITNRLKKQRHNPKFNHHQSFPPKHPLFNSLKSLTD